MKDLTPGTLIQLIDNMETGVAVWRLPVDSEDARNLVLLAANPRAQTRAGFPLGKLPGVAMGKVFRDVTKEQLDMLHRVAVDGAHVEPFEDLYASRWHSVAFLPVGPRTVGVICTDIHDKKLAEEQRERLDKDLEQFAFAASHDLQEPLRGVTNYATLLEEEFQGQLGDDGDLYLRYVVDSAKRMRAMIDGLLTFSRIGRNESFSVVSADQALDDAIVNLETTIEDHGAAITKDPLPEVYGDPHMLVRLFQNLISNGIKFRNGSQPRIHITATDAGDDWAFSVSDNGVGIDSRFSDRVFVIFQRLRKDRPGTGMGLSICKKIVERHGGRIWIESFVGKGTTVHFTIRKAVSDGGKKREEEAPADGGGQSGGRAHAPEGDGHDDVDTRGLCRPRWRGSPSVPPGGGPVLLLEAPRPRSSRSQPPASEWPRSAGGSGR